MEPNKLNLNLLKPILAIIPAKGTSTRLKQKNIRKLGEKTLLEWAISVAINSQIFDDIIVSTEDVTIAKHAKKLGASVPFLRPSKLSIDPSTVIDVVIHTIDELKKKSHTYKTIIILLPTCPLRNVQDLTESIKIFIEKKAHFLMSVNKCQHSPLSSLILHENGNLEPLHPEWIGKLGAKQASYKIPTLVRHNGAVIIANAEQLKNDKHSFIEKAIAYEMPWYRSVDIDTDQDLLFAEWLMKSEHFNFQ